MLPQKNNLTNLLPQLKNKLIAHIEIVCLAVIMAFIIVVLGFFKWSRPYSVIENLGVSKSNYIFGIDISHYQGDIHWEELKTTHHPIKYIFIRASMGADGVDERYHSNWVKAKENGYLRGAYHYYRPFENSAKQFENFKKTVNLEKGDFIPVLDIEKPSPHGIDNLRKGILNWLSLAEKEYGVKPIVYSGLSFYNDFLKGHLKDYPLWIAAYSGKHRLDGVDWKFHQFTENVKVKGIKYPVDGNDFNGSIKQLNSLLLD